MLHQTVVGQNDFQCLFQRCNFIILYVIWISNSSVKKENSCVVYVQNPDEKQINPEVPCLKLGHKIKGLPFQVHYFYNASFSSMKLKSFLKSAFNFTIFKKMLF